MSTATKRLRFLTVATLAFASTLAVSIPEASAGHGRFRWGGGGGGRAVIHIGGGARVGAVWSHRPWRWSGWAPRRHYVRGHVWLGSTVVVGGGYGYYYSEPPPPPPCEYPSVPAYYTQDAPPCPAETVAVAPEPRFRPRLGLGVTGGHFQAENGRDGDELGLLARLQLTRFLGVDLELGKTEQNDGARIDKRAGAALVLDLAPRSRISPYLVGGGGLSRAQVGSFTTEQTYGEVGAGLAFRLTDSLSIIGDYRVGRSTDNNDQPVIQATVLPPVQREENYSRGRLGAVLYF